MENNPKRKTDRTGNARQARQNRQNRQKSRKTGAGIGQKGDTAYDRLNKALTAL